MTRHNACLAVMIVSVSLLSCSDATEHTVDNGIDQLERQLELHHHADLLTRIAMADSTLAPFTTDGCSGGLSIGWEYLAGQIEAVRELHGDRPPWEDCCVAHDRRYHAAAPVHASTEESFELRKQADNALHACVITTANERAAVLASEYDVSAETVQTLYITIADLMYRAVRIGGMPCSYLPWRWGYGWPECD